MYRKLGLIEEIHPLPSNSIGTGGNALQLFAYMIIIDFESTCWEKNDRVLPNEISQFIAFCLPVHPLLANVFHIC